MSQLKAEMARQRACNDRLKKFRHSWMHNQIETVQRSSDAMRTELKACTAELSNWYGRTHSADPWTHDWSHFERELEEEKKELLAHVESEKEGVRVVTEQLEKAKREQGALDAKYDALRLQIKTS